MYFESLVGHITQMQDVLQAQAAHAVNLSLTERNWLVGYYIVEYEQYGEDRAKYGDILHNPVTLEFLGLESQDVYTYQNVIDRHGQSLYELSYVQSHEPKFDGQRKCHVPVLVREWRSAENKAV